MVQYTYDDANQLTSVVQVDHPNPSTTPPCYGYDDDGNLHRLDRRRQSHHPERLRSVNEPNKETLPGPG